LDTKDAGFWVPDQRKANEIADDLLFKGITQDQIHKRYKSEYENLIVKLDKDGNKLKEFSVLRALVDEGLENNFFEVLTSKMKFDPTHLNDIEIVNHALANKIPLVNEGDLLISMRNLHMIAILDKDTGALKWYKAGPWVRQHDVDISEDGDIVLFKNRPEEILRGGSKAQSNIYKFDPGNEKAEVLFPLSDSQETFYTEEQGSQQILPNGNVLIAESSRGRVLEMTSEGEVVWEYVQSYDEYYAAMFAVALRFDADYFTVSDWSCSVI